MRATRPATIVTLIVQWRWVPVTTLVLTVARALIWAVLVGLILETLEYGRVSMVGVLCGISAHPVWIGLVASYIFGYRLGVLPIQGYCNLRGAAAGFFLLQSTTQPQWSRALLAFVEPSQHALGRH